MTTINRSSDPALRDVAWVGYHPRTMAPVVALLAVASLVLWTGQWYQADLSELADRIGSLTLFALAWAVWPALIAVYLYRTVTYTYRLTDRAMLVDFGFLSRPVPAISFATVTAVVSGAGWLSRRLGVGWVELRTLDRAVRLPGVRHPTAFAIAIRNTIAKWKEQE
jgi:membrane protein YdbS with pleckstrin-like domain